MEQSPGFLAPSDSRLICKLQRSLYGLKQSPRTWFGRFSSVLIQFGMTRCEIDHYVFYFCSSFGKCIYLVYVDDIVIMGDDKPRIQQLKEHLSQQFRTKDLGPLKYFFGIEVPKSASRIVINQHNYALDILTKTAMLDCHPCNTPLDPNIKLLAGHEEPLKDSERYRHLVGRLNYLNIIKPDTTFAVSVVSQFLNAPCDSHWDAVTRIPRYIKGLQDKDYYMKTKAVPRSLVTLMRIGQDHHQIEDPLLDTVFLSEVTLSHGGARSKI